MARVLHLFNVLGAPTEATWLDVAQRLARAGHDITLAYETLVDGTALPGAGVQLPRVHVEPTDDVDAQMDRLARAEPLVSGAFDLVHGHLGTRLLHAAPYLARGVPVILSLYGYDAARLLRDPCWVRRYQWAARHGARFAVLCDAMADVLTQHGIPMESIRVVPLGIDPRKWPYEPQPSPTPPRFVFVGRLTAKKAPDLLIEAFRQLPGAGVGAVLDIVGDGPMRAQLEAAAAGADIRFHGELPRERVASVLRGATALVLPSIEAPDGDREGTPIVLMEAQALGTPCITTTHSGNPALLPPLPEVQRFVVQPGNVAALARAMSQIAEPPPKARLAIQDACRAWVVERFNLDATINRYDQLYVECTSNSQPAHSATL